MATSSRAERKCAQLLDGARAIILARGFEGATVDDIAREAGVSKATMYRYYADKAAIFAAVMQRDCGQQACMMANLVLEGRAVGDVLNEVGQRASRFMLSDDSLRVFRAAVAESERFPEVGAAFFAAGPNVGRMWLAGVLKSWADQGLLEIDDADLAAQRFFMLCKTDLFFRRLLGLVAGYTDAEIAAHVEKAVDAFLRMYRPA